MYDDYRNQNEENSKFKVENIPVLIEDVKADDNKAKPKYRKHNIAKTIAAVLAVVIIGGSAGGVGSYLVTKNNVVSDSPKQVVQIPIGDEKPEQDTETSAEITLANETLMTPQTAKSYSNRELYQLVKDSVVGIKIYQVDAMSYFYNGSTEPVGSVVGSGVIFTTDGYLITNYHVVEESTKISVMVNDYNDATVANEYPATVIGLDQNTDIAILKISRPEGFKASALGDSDTLYVGDEVVAIGNPMGLEKSMTKGIVSGLNRDEEGSGYELSSIQTDAALNMGNSGGPLFDMSGNVVGIVNKKYVYDNLVDNIGFAITINEAKPIINDLLENGTVTSRPVLGITIFATDQNSNKYGITGIVVQSIDPTAPVAKSGLLVGDIIIGVNGVDVTDITDVQTQLKKFKVGDLVDVKVVRISETGRTVEYDLQVELTKSSG